MCKHAAYAHLTQVSSLQLAALGPNTALFNLVFQVFSFCGVATTNVIANNSLTKPGLSDAQRQQREDTCSRILCYAGIVAVVLGCFATTGVRVVCFLLCLLGMFAVCTAYVRCACTACMCVYCV